MKWSAMTIVLLAVLIGAAVWIGHSITDDIPKAPSLQAQWLFVAAVLVAMCIGAGLIVNGRVDGILVDERRRLSLSRLQWVIWFVVLVSAFFVATVLNVQGGQANPFPEMQAELFGLIGLASGSAVLSNLIVDSKKSAQGVKAVEAVAPTKHAGAVPGNIGNIDLNAEPIEASWKDLYCGEEIANRDVVDVSRLQQLVTTLLLVMVYVGLLWRDLDSAAFTGEFLKMPAVSTTFLGLLGASHAGYLAYKATPKT